MQMILGKGTLKFELTKKYKMSDTKPFSENESGRLEEYMGRSKCTFTEFMILMQLTLNQRKTRFPLAETDIISAFFLARKMTGCNSSLC